MSDPHSHQYFQPGSLLAGISVDGPASRIERHGRVGVRADSLGTRLHLHAGHSLDHPRGALTFWVLPLEDLRSGIWWGHFAEAEPGCDRYALLTTRRELREVMSATFSLAWQQFWWRPLMARFCARHPEMHYRWWSHFGPCKFSFERDRWHQIGLSWDREARTASLYCDGVCLARTDSWKRPVFDPAGPDLYAGSTAFALGPLDFMDRALGDDDFARRFATSADPGERAAAARLRLIHAGEGAVAESPPDAQGYVPGLELSLTRPSELDRLYVQGNRSAVRITPEGLLVETPQGSPPLPEERRDADDQLQVYLHTWDSFEGDLRLEFEFMPLAHEGLGLVMLQAQGMQREDFMRDHPLRTTGSMRMVCWENVRNYHWEFFREMEGIRNDVATHALMKNPYFRGLAYQAMPRRIQIGEWHTVVFHQERGRLRGFVDGWRVFDVCDDESAHAGPVYDCGRVALRNMRNTRMLWRNLRVLTRPLPWRSEPLR